MNRNIHYTITETEQALTVRQFLQQRGYSRHILTHLKNTGMGICADGVPVYLNYVLHLGESLSVFLKEEASSENITPVPLPLSVLYEDEDILIVDKPSDMPIHPSMNNHDNSLANAVAYYYQSRNLPFVFRCSNRLDRDTSGLTIIAKNMLSASLLSDMAKNRLIRREYLAITEGIPDISGTIRAPIARKCGSAIERTVDFKNGDAAVTYYEVLSSISLKINGTEKKYSLLRVCLET